MKLVFYLLKYLMIGAIIRVLDMLFYLSLRHNSLGFWIRARWLIDLDTGSIGSPLSSTLRRI